MTAREGARARATVTRGDALAPLRTYREREHHLVVGLMTGTSADAVDAALVRFTGIGTATRHEIVRYIETPFEPALRREILETARAGAWSPERLLALDVALGECYAAAVLELLAAARVDPADVDLVGSHGQTIRHVPRHAGYGAALTLQIGSAAVIAERTGIAVVSDFRVRDAAAGGEGAPLVPLVDWWLFRSADESRVLLNLGGMANLTYLPKAGDLEDVIAFDTGPGNAVIDALVALRSHRTLFRDEGGRAAARGQASEGLLAELLADPFFAIPPPRSTGREHFGERYAERLGELGLEMALSEDDVLATAVELTATSIAQAIDRFVRPHGRVDRVCVSGGGVQNATLMGALARRLAPASVTPLAALGVAVEAKEALAFAFLAHQTLCGLPGNVTGATGASRREILGTITPGRCP